MSVVPITTESWAVGDEDEVEVEVADATVDVLSSGVVVAIESELCLSAVMDPFRKGAGHSVQNSIRQIRSCFFRSSSCLTVTKGFPLPNGLQTIEIVKGCVTLDNLLLFLTLCETKTLSSDLNFYRCDDADQENMIVM